MTAMRPWIGWVLTAALVGPAVAAQGSSEPGRLAIGATGIACVTTPCPSRGVVKLDDDSRDPLRPFWWGERPPRLDASPADAARIEAAWDAMKCLEIQGMVLSDPAGGDMPLIRVERILGPCP